MISNKVYTSGTIEKSVLDKNKLFHVVDTDFPISTEGILGRPFLREERFNVSFFYNALITDSRPVDPIPFIDRETAQSKKNLEKEVKPVPRTMKVGARTRQIIQVPVLNIDSTEGYLPKIYVEKGLYMGEALVASK